VVLRFLMPIPSLETILQHQDLEKSVVARETMLTLRACCRAGRAVVDKFAEELWYPSLFQGIFKSAVLDQFLDMWRFHGWNFEFLNCSIAKGVDGRIRIFFFDDPGVLTTHDNIPVSQYMLEIGLQQNGLDVRVVTSSAEQEDCVGYSVRLKRQVTSVNMLRKSLLGNLWHPKRQACEDKDWPVERGIEQKCFCYPQSGLVVACIDSYKGLEMNLNKLDFDEFVFDRMGNLVVKIHWMTGRGSWHHEARLVFSCAPSGPCMKLEISSDGCPKKRYRWIRSAGRMLQILYY
jgi:hypothetical protein